MKKIICLVLTFAFICLAMSSCFLLDENYVSKDDTTDSTAGLPDYAGTKEKDVDDNGNFILSSTDNRHVYVYGSGYAVFTFSGQAVTSIKYAVNFDNEEAASQYMSDEAKKAIDKGVTPPTMSIYGGTCVVTNIGYDPQNAEGLSKYYIQSRSDVEAAFNEEAKQ